MKHILFISYDGMTDPLGQSQVIPYLKGLTKYEYRFTILSCEKPGRFQNEMNLVLSVLKDYPIRWIPLKYHKKPPVLSTLLDIYNLKKKAIEIYKTDPFIMVHTRVGIPSIVGHWLKKKFGVKFMNDIREFYADSRVDGGMWNQKKILYRKIYHYFKRLEKKQLQDSDGVVCLTHAAKRILLQLTYFPKDVPLEVIPCSVDLNLFDPDKIDIQEQIKLRKSLGIDETDFVISYLGSVGGWYLITEMFKMCSFLLEKNKKLKVLFISPGNHELIREEANRAEIPEKNIVIRRASRTEVPLILSLSNASVFFIKPCFSKQSSSPTKHGEIMAMGIPIISNSGVGDVSEIINESNSGIVINSFTEESMREAVEEIFKRKFDKADIRKAAFKYYELETAIEKYKNIYHCILDNSSTRRIACIKKL